MPIRASDIHQHAMQLRTRQDPQMPLPGTISAFRPSIMVGVPAVWESIREGIVAEVNSGSLTTKTIVNGVMHVHPGSCAARR